MIFVDTGAWFANVVPTDPDYISAANWWSGNREPLLTTDYVVDELLTLLRARGQSQRALEAGARLFSGDLAAIHYVSRDEIALAWDVFRRFADKHWSFTDCTSKVVMESLGITTSVSFDQHFRQFGNIEVVPH